MTRHENEKEDSGFNQPDEDCHDKAWRKLKVIEDILRKRYVCIDPL